MQKNKIKKYISVLVLVVIFSIPFFAAFFLFTHPALWRHLSSTNYGNWAPKTNWQLNQAKARAWQIVLWNDGSCEQSCMQTLDQLGRVRLAMGRKVYEVDIVLVVPEGIEISSELERQLKEWNFYYQYLPLKDKPIWNKNFKQYPIVLFGPEHESVLEYPLNFDSKKMYHDFQVLVK
jgi:hypothetical protein